MTCFFWLDSTTIFGWRWGRRRERVRSEKRKFALKGEGDGRVVRMCCVDFQYRGVY